MGLDVLLCCCADTTPSSVTPPQEMQIVVEAGVLYIIDTRTAKRSARAAVCVAASMVRERMITEREALQRIEPNNMDFYLHPMIVSHRHCPVACDR